MKKTTVKRPYEAPKVTVLGGFRTETGLLGRSGNDRLILSKN
ncbi:keywimysin-related RiPP [Actinoplanes flavus]|nr:keywimysin-related RiPP [Actinoplanes flavus]